MRPIISRARRARSGQSRCTARTRRIAYDTTAQWRQRCALPIGHEGQHRWQWEEINA